MIDPPADIATWFPTVEKATLLIVGLILGYLSAYFVERRKEKTAKRTQLRNAYAAWFTNERMLLPALSQILAYSGNRNRPELTERFSEALTAIAEAITTMLQSAHEILLLEGDQQRAGVVRNVTNMLKDVHDAASQELYVQRLHGEMRAINVEYDAMLEVGRKKVADLGKVSNGISEKAKAADSETKARLLALQAELHTEVCEFKERSDQRNANREIALQNIDKARKESQAIFQETVPKVVKELKEVHEAIESLKTTIVRKL